MASPDIPDNLALQFKIRLSIEEIVENIVRYAYENGSGFLEASTQRVGDMLHVSFSDAGRPFNPLAKPDPDTSLPADQRPIGGLGIYLCKRLMDDVCYEYSDGLNILTLKKRISHEKTV